MVGRAEPDLPGGVGEGCRKWGGEESSASLEEIVARAVWARARYVLLPKVTLCATMGNTFISRVVRSPGFDVVGQGAALAGLGVGLSIAHTIVLVPILAGLAPVFRLTGR